MRAGKQATSGGAGLEAVVGEGRLVDLDAEAGPVGQVELVAAQLALDGGDRLGEEPLGRQAVREAVVDVRSRNGWTAWAAAAIPTGPSSALVT